MKVVPFFCLMVYSVYYKLTCMLVMCLAEVVSATCEPENSFSFFVARGSSSSSSDSMLSLSSDLTLGHINGKYWKSNRPLELFYVLDDESSHRL